MRGDHVQGVSDLSLVLFLILCCDTHYSRERELGTCFFTGGSVLQGHQKSAIMVTNIDTTIQERGRMTYHAKGKLMDLDEHEEDSTHQVCSLLMISGLPHLDARVQSGYKDYKTDPLTGAMEKNCPCPRCGYYLKEFLMRKTNFIPTVERFFCSGCLTTRKIPGYGKITAVCLVQWIRT